MTLCTVACMCCSYVSSTGMTLCHDCARVLTRTNVVWRSIVGRARPLALPARMPVAVHSIILTSPVCHCYCHCHCHCHRH